MSGADQSSTVLGLAVIVSLLALVAGQFDDQPEVRDQGPDISSGISRLLLKNMRFRDLEGVKAPPEDKLLPDVSYAPYTQGASTREKSLDNLQSLFTLAKRPMSKRERTRHLMNNLAEMLSGNRERDSGSALRMPSLRFG